MSTQPNYLAGYPVAVTTQVHTLIAQNRLADWLLKKYPQAHEVRTDKALYDFALLLKNEKLRNVGQLSKVAFDNKLHVIKNALGTHTTISRVQGAKLISKREIRIASLFKEMPLDFLRMIVAHELAHFKHREHDKAFYQLCQHLAPNYAQLEFELRVYLTYLEAGGVALWAPNIPTLPCV
jgi:predicted metal-dependent hydrolase